MVAPHDPSTEVVVSLFFSDAQRNKWILRLGAPFSEAKRLDEDHLMRKQWDNVIRNTPSIKNPLSTIFVLSTNINTRVTGIIAGFDTMDEPFPANDGHMWLSQFNDPDRLISRIYTILVEMGAITHDLR